MAVLRSVARGSKEEAGKKERTDRARSTIVFRDGVALRRLEIVRCINEIQSRLGSPSETTVASINFHPEGCFFVV